MSVLREERRPGAYYDSIVLMRLQSALAGLPRVVDAGVVMATPANLALLEANDLLPAGTAVAAEDLLIVVRAETEEAAEVALSQVDQLLARRSASEGDEYQPRSLETACRMLPDASWALISVPGRYAAEVAHRALDHRLNVFLYSDNVSLEEEVELKNRACRDGLLVLGPDCGTAIIGGVGLGFANRARQGTIGLVGASGTGLQAISSRIHGLGAGISHAIGTGGRDLKAEVGATSALQALDVLARDPATEVIVLVSKPPSATVAARLLNAAQDIGKPVVIDFIGYPSPGRRLGRLHFAASLDEAAVLAVELTATAGRDETVAIAVGSRAPYLRGLFAGGTLAQEALLALRAFLQPLASNLAIESVAPLEDSNRSVRHTVLDLGEDEFTVGRLHPMMDQELRLRRLRQEAADPEVGAILLDVVLGYGSHPDPASELAPVIEEIRRERELEILVVILGTDEDPQDLEAQTDRLSQAGARVFFDVGAAVEYIHRIYSAGSLSTGASDFPMVSLDGFGESPAAINLGLETFYESLVVQEARVVHVDWRPPAGGNEELMRILEKMRP